MSIGSGNRPLEKLRIVNYCKIVYVHTIIKKKQIIKDKPHIYIFLSVLMY